MRYKNNDRYDGNYANGYPKLKPPRYLCFRHAVQEAMAGVDVEICMSNAPYHLLESKVWCVECRQERDEE